MLVIRKDKKKKLDIIALCDVPVGFVFKFKNDEIPMLKLSRGCGYCELGEGWDSVEMLDRRYIEDNIEMVTVYGKLKAIIV